MIALSHGETLTRLRPRQKPDPYNPDATIPDWGQTPDEATLPPAAWRSETTQTTGDNGRRETTRRADVGLRPGADIALGDRLRRADGTIWTVVALLDADASPFTGWRPGLIARVERVEG
ncbi:MAG: hypothetical protein LBK42_13785 [Propionibacteriaceae bacterium]|jgi:hypothetical protein|nr:hypothetical protein [Propionibacteriaceae bacterium]